MYAFDSDVNGGTVITIPRLPGFSLDVPAICAAVRKHKPKVVFLTSPNNPDGSMIAEEELLEILALPVLVVLDEAYIEFSGEGTRMPWVTRVPNLVVLRTFSKSAGLAGLRVGCARLCTWLPIDAARCTRLHHTLDRPKHACIARACTIMVTCAVASRKIQAKLTACRYGAFPDDIIKYLWRAKQPYNVSVASETAALAAMSNAQYMADVRQRLVDERGRLFQLLQDIPFLAPYPSEANFLLCQVRTDNACCRLPSPVTCHRQCHSHVHPAAWHEVASSPHVWSNLQAHAHALPLSLDSSTAPPIGVQINGRDAKGVKDQLAAEYGIMIRHYQKKLLDGYVRISVGKPEQTDKLIEALKVMA
jgi:histidinol-phosphate/aromatic aminotransferase/cobyric acid decarboxylase-like protein